MQSYNFKNTRTYVVYPLFGICMQSMKQYLLNLQFRAIINSILVQKKSQIQNCSLWQCNGYGRCMKGTVEVDPWLQFALQTQREIQVSFLALDLISVLICPVMDCYARRRWIYFMQDKGWHGHRLENTNPSSPGACKCHVWTAWTLLQLLSSLYSNKYLVVSYDLCAIIGTSSLNTNLYYIVMICLESKRLVLH